MIDIKAYLNKFILAFRTEQKEHDIQSESYTNQAILIHIFESLKDKLKKGKFRLLEGLLRKRRMPRLSFGNYKNPEFNGSQLQAINGCRRNRIAIIWGSPGTERNKTITRIITNTVNKGKTVLFLAPFDKEVDEGALKVCEIFKNHKIYSSGKIVRFGGTQEEWLEKKCPRAVPSLYLKGDLKILAKQIEEFEKKIDNFQNKISRITTIANDIKKLKQEHRNLKCYREEFKKTKKDEEYFEIKKNAVRRQEREIAALAEQIKRALKGLKISKGNVLKFKAKYEKQKQAVTLKQDHLIDQKNNKEKEYFRGAKIYFTTIAKTFSDNLFPKKPYDLLIIDEANRVSMPYIFWTLTLGGGSVVFVGDHRQPPPACLSQKEDAQKWLTENIFSFLDLDSPSSIDGSPIAFPIKK